MIYAFRELLKSHSLEVHFLIENVSYSFANNKGDTGSEAGVSGSVGEKVRQLIGFQGGQAEVLLANGFHRHTDGINPLGALFF